MKRITALVLAMLLLFALTSPALAKDRTDAGVFNTAVYNIMLEQYGPADITTEQESPDGFFIIGYALSVSDYPGHGVIFINHENESHMWILEQPTLLGIILAMKQIEKDTIFTHGFVLIMDLNN